MNLAILGSTGFLGRQILDVVRHYRERFSIFGLACQRNYSLLLKQAKEFSPRYLVLYQEDAVKRIKREGLPAGAFLLYGQDGIMEIVSHPEVDMVFFLASGTELLNPLLLAIDKKKRVCLASKELVVAFGKFIFARAKEKGVEIIPADSEICALHQCLSGNKRENIKRVIITSSGGPFFGSGKSKTLRNVLGHPVWRMGKKITVDSATLMNKGFEVIEVVRFFGLSPEKISVLIHPQVIIHSLVEFIDGHIISQMAVPDMRLFLQYALTYPESLPSFIKPLDWRQIKRLDFFPADDAKFPCLSLAKQAIRKDGSLPAVLVAADEIAVAYFLSGKIKFSCIPKIIGDTLSWHRHIKNPLLPELLVVEREAKEKARELAERYKR